MVTIRRGMLCGGLLFAVLAAGPGQAQQGGHAGDWHCQMAYTEFDQNGNRTSGFVRDFALRIDQANNFQAYGTIGGAAGYNQFQSQGQFQVEGATIYGGGPEQSSNSMTMPGLQFAFTGTLQPDGRMSYTFEQPDPNRQYVMARTNYYCERQG